MRLKIFDVIESTLATLENNIDYYQDVEKQLHAYFNTILSEQCDRIVDINSRIKQKESLREKIIRNRFYIKYDNAQDILDNLSDLMGFMIECRFIEDEYEMLSHLRSVLTDKYDDTYSYHPDYPNICIDVKSQQPQIQKNGFAIYRMDGWFEENGVRVNFELQIKALVHAFWGDIEHKLVYKNTNYFIYDDFMKDLLSTIKANLTITDRQLHIIYDQMHTSTKRDSSISEASFEKQIAKAINDLFTTKMEHSIGFSINIKDTANILGRYIFLKDVMHDNKQNDQIASLFRTFKKLNSGPIDFENEISVEHKFSSNEIFNQILGDFLLSIVNKDYEWYVFFKMLFAIEPGNNLEDFCLFLDIIRNYLIDAYWFGTSFAKLSMKDATALQAACSIMLANSLCEIGKINIIHDDKMQVINGEFVKYIEELEERVISYHDFELYQGSYFEEWQKRMNAIFV